MTSSHASATATAPSSQLVPSELASGSAPALASSPTDATHEVIAIILHEYRPQVASLGSQTELYQELW